MRGGGDVFCKNCPRPLSNSPPPLKKRFSGRHGRSPSLSGGEGLPAPDRRKDSLSCCHVCCLIEGILAACPAESNAPSYIAISGSTLFLASRTPASRRSKTIRPVFSVARHWNCWPKLQKTKSGHPEDVRFSIARRSATEIFQKDHMSGFGGGVGSCPLFSAGSAVPVATEEATGIAATQRGGPSPRNSLSPLPTVPPAPRRGRGHPDGWPRNWRVRNRRRTDRCAAA